MSAGRQFLQQALTATEQKRFAEALNFTDQALIAFAESQDLEGYAETYSMKFHTFKHLLTYTDFVGFHYSALSCALLGAQIAQEYHLEKRYVMFINAAKALDQAGQTSDAIKHYDLALTAMQENPKSRQAEAADTQSHKDALLLARGDVAAEQRILDNITVVQTSTDITAYERDVWASGAYLRLVKAFKNHDQAKSNAYLQKAKEIIESNPDLVIRKDQLQKVAAEN